MLFTLMCPVFATFSYLKLNEKLIEDYMFKQKKKFQNCFRPGSNRGPSACQADVITTTPRKLDVQRHPKLLIKPTCFSSYIPVYEISITNNTFCHLKLVFIVYICYYFVFRHLFTATLTPCTPKKMEPLFRNYLTEN